MANTQRKKDPNVFLGFTNSDGEYVSLRRSAIESFQQVYCPVRYLVVLLRSGEKHYVIDRAYADDVVRNILAWWEAEA